VSLSEQQLVDCDTEDLGCNGGWPYRAIGYISSNEGIDTEDSYPYNGVVSHAFILFCSLYIYHHWPSLVLPQRIDSATAACAYQNFASFPLNARRP